MTGTKQGHALIGTGSRFAFTAAILAAFWIGGCEHEHHDEDRGSPAAWHDRDPGWEQHDHERQDHWDRDRDRD